MFFVRRTKRVLALERRFWLFLRVCVCLQQGETRQDQKVPHLSPESNLNPYCLTQFLNEQPFLKGAKKIITQVAKQNKRWVQEWMRGSKGPK